MTDNLLAINNLSVHYQTPRGRLQALRHVSLQVPQGAIVGVVGESGCGKSTLISSIIQLLPGNAEVSNGQIMFNGSDLVLLSDEQMRMLRGTAISVVFQDPMSTLNPVLSIGTQMLDIQYRDSISRAEKIARSTQMLARVGLSDPAQRLKHYPHEFSGGMQQRISIAMALQANPTLLIADEPTTALDATLEIQIIGLLKELQSDIGCSILFVSHHLGVIAELCEYVVVMYAGEVVEQGRIQDVFYNPAHPYTQKLLECDPAAISKKSRQLPTIVGELPDLISVPAGCVFRERCEHALQQCSSIQPRWQQHRADHYVACHNPRQL